MTLHSIVDLFDHMAWADGAVWRAVLACDPATRDQKLRDALYHLHVVQRAFLRTWLGEPRETPYPEFEETAAMVGWARAYAGDARRCAGCRRLEHDDRLDIFPASASRPDRRVNAADPQRIPAITVRRGAERVNVVAAE